MQRRVEQADGDRKPGHDLEQFGEVLALHRQELGERGAASLLGVGEDHLAHRDDPLAVEEHVLGAAEADALGAERAGDAGVGRGLGVGAHLHSPDRVGPAHERREIAGHLRLHHRRRALHHFARAAVDGEDVALLQRHAAHGHRLAVVVDADRADAARRRACPCRARPPRHARSCRRASSRRLRPRACHECPPARSRPGPGSTSVPPGATIAPRRRKRRSRRWPRRARRAGRLRAPRASPSGQGLDAGADRARRARSGSPRRRARSGLRWPSRPRSGARLSPCACRCGSAASTICRARP